jgi:foldase protein PrsA
VLAGVVAAAAPAEKLEPDVICTVNGEPIRLKDLDRALFLDDHQHYVKHIRRFLVKERVVRQRMSDKGVSVRAADVAGYVKDLDRMLRAQGKTLPTVLKGQGMTEAFFRRKCEQVVGLYRLVGGKGRPSKHLTDPRTNTAMNSLLIKLEREARVVVDLNRLPADTAAIVNGEKIGIEEAGKVARIGLSAKLLNDRLRILQYYFLVNQEIRRQKIRFGKDDLEYQIKLASAAKATRIGEKEFPLEKVLAKLGRDVELLKRQYGFRAVAMLTRLVKKKVTEKELSLTFDANRAKFGDGVPKASHIFISDVNKKGRRLTARESRKKQDLAEKLYKRLQAGEDFAKLAGEFSEDARTAHLGGNLGWQSIAAIEKNKVARTAYRLKAGEVSRPIYGRAGWHIVKVTEVNRVKLEQVKPAVLGTVVAKYRRELLKELLKKAEIKRGPARI